MGKGKGMSVVFGAIAPHGFHIIPRISKDADGGLVTRAAMEELGKRCAAAEPDTIVVATPHGIRVTGSMAVGVTGKAAGIIRDGENSAEMNIAVDLDFARQLARTSAELGIPTAEVSAGGNRDQQKVYPLDWGAFTPLWFLGHDRHVAGQGDMFGPAPESTKAPPAVIVSPSRDLPRETMIAFGRAVAQTAADSGKRIAFIASCDWAHTHSESGPYGAHPSASRVDDFVVTCIRDGDLAKLLEVSDQDADDAAIDGLWQALMLAGILESVPLQHELLSYEAPTYFGMIVASYVTSAS